jgi:hypothetical protein
MGLVGEGVHLDEFVSVHSACIVSLLSDKFSALAGLVRKYVLALKSGYMAAYGSLRLSSWRNINCVPGGSQFESMWTKFFSFWQPSSINYHIKPAFQFLNITFPGPAANHDFSLVAKSFEPAAWQSGLFIFPGCSKVDSYNRMGNNRYLL